MLFDSVKHKEYSEILFDVLSVTRIKVFDKYLSNDGKRLLSELGKITLSRILFIKDIDCLHNYIIAFNSLNKIVKE